MGLCVSWKKEEDKSDKYNLGNHLIEKKCLENTSPKKILCSYEGTW